MVRKSRTSVIEFSAKGPIVLVCFSFYVPF